MNVKQEIVYLHEGVFKTEPDIISEQTLPRTLQKYENDVFVEFETGTRKQIDEIKQEKIECEETKIQYDSLQEEKLQFCPSIIKKELKNTSELIVTDIEDIKEDICEYVQCKSELLTMHCDLQTLKNENTEYPDSLAESCEREEDENISKDSNIKNSSASKSTDNLDGHVQKSVTINTFGGKLKKDSQTNLLTRANKKQFKCDTCSNIFRSKSKLQRHLVTHTKEKLFKCEICSKQFAQKYTLKSHLITHTNEKPFRCDICPKAFSYKCTLQTHLLTHTSEKQFKCNVCSKAFKRKDNLHSHLILHTNAKPYMCDICSKQFTQKSNFNLHLKTHTNKKRLKADV